LPAEIHPVTMYLVDPLNHCHGSHLYKLEKKLKEMKKTDCKCLIHNFGYAVNKIVRRQKRNS